MQLLCCRSCPLTVSHSLCSWLPTTALCMLSRTNSLKLHALGSTFLFSSTLAGEAPYSHGQSTGGQVQHIGHTSPIFAVCVTHLVCGHTAQSTSTGPHTIHCAALQVLQLAHAAKICSSILYSSSLLCFGSPLGRSGPAPRQHAS